MALIMLGFKSYTMSGRTNKTCVKRRWFSASNWSMRSKATAGDRYALKSPCVSDVLAAKEGNGEPGPWQATQPLPKYNQVETQHAKSHLCQRECVVAVPWWRLKLLSCFWYWWTYDLELQIAQLPSVASSSRRAGANIHASNCLQKI